MYDNCPQSDRSVKYLQIPQKLSLAYHWPSGGISGGHKELLGQERWASSICHLSLKYQVLLMMSDLMSVARCHAAQSQVALEQVGWHACAASSTSLGLLLMWQGENISLYPCNATAAGSMDLFGSASPICKIRQHCTAGVCPGKGFGSIIIAGSQHCLLLLATP